MKRIPILVSLAVLSSCWPAKHPPPPGPERASAATDELLRLQARHREESLERRRFTHSDLWAAVGPTIEGSSLLKQEEVGRSAEGRPIYAVHYGAGPTRVLLWSQMHGDESTATMALADLIRFFAREPDHPIARRIAQHLSIQAVPMLNPDGAERFQRRNVYGVDVNRDARTLATPEGRTLKAVQERFRPDFGFNLHDQNVRTTVGASTRFAALALLAPPFDASRADNPVRTRAKQVAAVIRQSAEPLVAGHITKYDDTFNPRAFGDLMQQWGVSTVLLESGGWRDDPEKQHLRAVTFVAIVAALDAIATGDYQTADPSAYESLPQNGPAINDLLLRGGRLVFGDLEPVRVDVSINYTDPLLRTGGAVVEVGDLGGVAARDTVDISGLFLHPAPEALVMKNGAPVLPPGAPASFIVREDADPRSASILVLTEGVVRDVR